MQSLELIQQTIYTDNCVCGFDLQFVISPLHQTTPLHMATKNHHKGIKKYLVDHGADIDMKDGVRKLHLYLAMRLISRTCTPSVVCGVSNREIIAVNRCIYILG